MKELKNRRPSCALKRGVSMLYSFTRRHVSTCGHNPIPLTFTGLAMCHAIPGEQLEHRPIFDPTQLAR